MGNLFEISLILFLTILNGLFSSAETAVVSARRARLQQRADAGDDAARAALELANKPERFLSTVQIGITLIGILAGAFGGTNLSADIAQRLQKFGLSASLSHTLGFGLVVALITYLSLVIGELVPKTLALNNAENIACRVARPMGILSRFAAPLVAILTVSTNGVLRLMGVRASVESPVTEDEINILIAQGAKVGVFAEEEREIVERVFRAADRRVSALMTPRREITYLDVDNDWKKNLALIASSNHSAYPVCQGGMDNILGVTVLRFVWSEGAEGHPIDLRRSVQKPIYVLETVRALQVLDAFKGTTQHIALVVDEYGNVVGLLTLHDVLEALVGEVSSSPDYRPEDMSIVQREDGSWLLDGMLPIDEMLHVLNIKEIPEDERDYNTLGGFMMARLGRIPNPADHFMWADWRFEVLDMDGHRVDRVLASQGDVPTSRSFGDISPDKQP